MNKRQVIILWVIAIALGGAVTAVKLTRQHTAQSSTQRAAGQTVFSSFPAAEIASVEIQGTTGTVTLVKKDRQWTVAQRADYPANPAYVNGFIRTLGELKVTRGMEAGPSFAPRFGMDEAATNPADRGLTATFKDAAGKTLAKVSLGKTIASSAEATPFGGSNAVGRYVRNHGDASGFYAVNETFPAVSADPSRWLADDFFNPEKIQTISLSQSASEQPAWQLTRVSEDAEFTLVGAAANEVLDTAATTPLKSLFSYARFDDVIPGTPPAAGQRQATITTFEGFTYALTITPAASAPPTNPASPQTPATDNYLLTVKVSAQLPPQRKAEAGEKPADAKTKDTAFNERLQALTAKLAKEQTLAGRTFAVNKTTVEPLLKERAQLITKATPPPTTGSNNGSVNQLPGGLIATPPAPLTPPAQP